MAGAFEIGSAFISVVTQDRTQQGTESMGKSLMKWGAGLGLGALITSQIVGGLDIEAGIDKMQAQLGISADRAGELGKLAGDLYANNYGESMAGVQDVIVAVTSTMPGMAEAGDQAIKDLSVSAMNFETAFGVPVEETINSASLLMTNGLATSGEEAMDLLTASMQKLPVALRGELGPIIDEYGKDFAALGFTGEESMKLLTKAASTGAIGLDHYGDAMKEFLINAGTNLAQTGPYYEAMGLDAQKMADMMLAGGDSAFEATSEIRNGLLAITDPTEQAAAAIAFFGTPLEDLGANQVPAFLDGLVGMEDGMGAAEGAAKDLDATLNGNTKATFETFKRQALMGLSDVVNTQVIPAIAWLVAKFVEFKTPITIIAGLLMSVLIPALVIAGIQATISAAKQVVAWVVTQAGAVAGAATSVIAAATVVAGWVLMGVQSLLGAAKVAAAWLIAMGPIALVIAAVVGLVALIIIYWDEIKAAISTAIQWVIDWVSANWPLLLAIILGPLGLIVGYVITHWDQIYATISGAMGSVKDAVSNGIDFVTGKFDSLVSFVTGLPGRIAQAASGMFDGISSAFKVAINAVVDWWNGLSFPTFTLPKVDLGPLGSIGGQSWGGWDLPNIIKPFATGGFIPAKPGGTFRGIGQYGEAGQDEIVSPVPMLEKIVRKNSNGGGLTNEDRALLRAVADRPVQVIVDGRTLLTTMRRATQLDLRAAVAR